LLRQSPNLWRVLRALDSKQVRHSQIARGAILMGSAVVPTVASGVPPGASVLAERAVRWPGRRPGLAVTRTALDDVQSICLRVARASRPAGFGTLPKRTSKPATQRETSDFKPPTKFPKDKAGSLLHTHSRPCT